MTTHVIPSKVTIHGHPIHAMIVGFPIALYTSGLAALIVFAAKSDPFWFRAGCYLMLAGAAMAVVAAVFGVIDLFTGIPRSERAARKTGVIHFGLNLVTLVLFAGAGLSMLATMRDPQWGQLGGETHYGLPLVLGIIGLVLLLGAGWFGWNLVQRHHVGIEPDEA